MADVVPTEPDEVTVADLCGDDSEFIGVGSINVHYKIAYPQKVGVTLQIVHSFPLSELSDCRTLPPAVPSDDLVGAAARGKQREVRKAEPDVVETFGRVLLLPLGCLP